MNLSELIEIARKEPKERLRELADQEIDCGFSTLDNYLLGRTAAGEKLLKKLSVFLNCKVSDLPRELPKEQGDGGLKEGPPANDWAIMFSSEQLNQKVIEVLQDTQIPLDERHRRAEMILVKLRERLAI